MLLRRGRLFGHGLLNRRFVLRLVRLRFFRDHLRRLRLRIVERVCEFLHRLRSLLHGINRLRCIAAGREAQKQRQQKKQRRQLPFHIHSPCHRFIILTQIARLRNCRPARSVLE